MANLASIILEGAGMTTGTLDTSAYDFEDTVVEESSYVDGAVATLFTDIMEAEQAYMVADVVGAAMYVRESATGSDMDLVAVTEGVLKDTVGKIKNAFLKFIAKIKDFYKRVINWFKAMFSNAENFVKNYGSMIQAKASKVKGFTYSGFKYDKAAGDAIVEDVKSKTDAKILDLASVFDKIDSTMSQSEFNDAVASNLDAKFDAEKKPSSTEEQEAFLKTLKADDIAELRQNIVEAYQGGDTVKQELKDFEGVSVKTMCDFLKKSSDTIKKLQSDLSSYENKVNKIVNKFDKFSSKNDDETTNTNLASHASYISQIITAILNVYKAAADTRVSVYKAMSSSWLAVLKKFYNYKGNKGVYESVEFDAEAFSTLESADVFEACGGKKLEGCGESDDDDEEDDVEEGCKKKCAEGCTESTIASILEQASSFTF